MTPEDLERIATDIATLDEHIDKLTAERDALKDRLRSVGVGKHAAGNLTVTVSPNRRFSQEKAIKALERNELSALRPIVERTKVEVDAKKLEALAPEVYAACCTTYADKVSVK